MVTYVFDGFEIDPTTRDIAVDALGPDGRLRILPASYWGTTTRQERALFGHRYGYYGFPTMELVDYLRRLIGSRSAIEIGAGNGVLAEALGIPATDSRAQEEPHWREVYESLGQTPVPYGPNVEKCHASRAVRQYKPDVVVGCWVTHKWDPTRPWAKGFEFGVDEEDILRNCKEYVIIGNANVHRDKRIWDRHFTVSYPSFVYSRARGGRDFIAVWRGLKR